MRIAHIQRSQIPASNSLFIRLVGSCAVGIVGVGCSVASRFTCSHDVHFCLRKACENTFLCGDDVKRSRDESITDI